MKGTQMFSKYTHCKFTPVISFIRRFRLLIILSMLVQHRDAQAGFRNVIHYFLDLQDIQECC